MNKRDVIVVLSGDDGGVKVEVVGVIIGNGSVLVGSGPRRNGWDEGFRGTAGDGVMGIGFLPIAQRTSNAIDVSADGSAIGGVDDVGGFAGAFPWTEQDGTVGLGSLPGGNEFSLALAVTPDGRVIVGVSSTDRGNVAFRWTEDGGIQPVTHSFPPLGPGVNARILPLAMNADGSVVVGQVLNGGAIGGFIWDETCGTRGFPDFLCSDHGLALPTWHGRVGRDSAGRDATFPAPDLVRRFCHASGRSSFRAKTRTAAPFRVSLPACRAVQAINIS